MKIVGFSSMKERADIMRTFNCPLLPFWRFFGVTLFFVVFLVLYVGFFLFLCRITSPFFYVFFAALAAIYFWRMRWLWRLTWQTWRFRARTTSRVILYCSAQTESRWDLAVILRRIESEMEELTQRFGFGLRSRVAVFLFPSWRDVAKVFNRELTGAAFGEANAVFLAEDTFVVEMIRHELCHLFSARWNAQAPLILSEALATWWQNTFDGRPVDTSAETLVQDRSLDVPSLLKTKGFVSGSRRQDYYLLAGGFTGFLIRRFGWESYRKFYRSAHRFNFRSRFQKVFGVSLDRAERQWRYDKLARELVARTLHRV
jgi:hypothetical protein